MIVLTKNDILLQNTHFLEKGGNRMNVINAFQALEQSLKLAHYRQQAISQNIANADTPFYKAVDVSFQSVLENAGQVLEGKRTDPRHFRIGQAVQPSPYKVVTRGNTTENNNENNVDIDQEMVNLAQNTVYYQTLAQLAGFELNQLRQAIRGGR
jgi:flagellar basal-body rod protein FlgB